ncbi:serine protease inhibitor, putative [Pediculus humanus corporis]|uniref:Serine protease inhibitor, putative n=1 Tax=Pediculus humanus subsp. corporis TaxID=121224 RepID=E0VX15_PEDHC|nr:serine protease inhibitor, putative [Pediculus humanus corporis]EEB17921.1 serine protease inhibitor, putative [Pediculus humanus corporis]
MVFSPISIWTILAVLLEGSTGKTENELKLKLKMSYRDHDEGVQILRSRYNDVIRSLEDKNGTSTEFSSLNFVITDKNVTSEFKKIFENYYHGKYFNIDNKKSNLFSVVVNGWAQDESNGRIKSIVSSDMLDNVVMILGNAVYFKSKWKYPFDSSDTFPMPFKNDNGKVIANIPMMNVAAVLPLGYNSYLDSQIIEIPYEDDVTSMIIILPHQKTGLEKVLSLMKSLTLDEIIPKNTSEETVQISLPKFRVTSKMYLNDIFQKELPTMFSSQSAEFHRIGKDVFVSKIYHKAEIENSEEGTIVSAVSRVQFPYKSSSSVFRADHPFVYLINDIKTRTILFAGTFSNPFMATTSF